MEKKIINENPLLILPSLAMEIGLNEAIVLQQIHYWLQISDNHIQGHYWVYNTYKDWREQFPFWSTVTIRRILYKLEADGFIITGNYNSSRSNHTKWYTINYKELKNLICWRKLADVDYEEQEELENNIISFVNSLQEKENVNNDKAVTL